MYYYSKGSRYKCANNDTCCICTFIHSGLGSISIKVEPLVVKFDNSDIDIRCIVDGTTLTHILSIQLIRSNTTGSNTPVVTVTQKRVELEDAALENTTGVTVNASVSNVMSSYLHLEIPKTVVRYPEDMGSYQCSLLALDSLGGLVEYHSLIVNITGQYKLYSHVCTKNREYQIKT